MKRFTVLVIAAALAAAFATDSLCSPKSPPIDSGEKPVLNIGPENVVVRYFEASKAGDAKTAVSLIDYDAWAKEMGLAGNAKETWIANHKSSLQDTYDQHKTEGSTKDFKILSTKRNGAETVFEVSQERKFGDYVWLVKVISTKKGWRIKSFDLEKVQPKNNR